MSIRLPVAGGTFYPADPNKLRLLINNYLARVNNQITITPRAIIVPHAGYEFSGLVAAYAYKLLAESSYSRIILLGPSHYFSFSGLASSPSQEWQTSLGKVPVIPKNDLPSLKDISLIHDSEIIHQPEHCLEVQLPFLQIVLKKKWKIFPLIMGDIDPKTVAQMLLPLLDSKTILIVSSDLSHYLPYPQAQKTDQKTIQAILQGDPLKFQTEGNACGKIPIAVLMYIAQYEKWRPHLLKALNSGDMTGKLERVVGYASFAYSE